MLRANSANTSSCPTPDPVSTPASMSVTNAIAAIALTLLAGQGRLGVGRSC
jgi:hypothetical protein